LRREDPWEFRAVGKNIWSAARVTTNRIGSAGKWTVPDGGRFGNVVRRGALPTRTGSRRLLQCDPAQAGNNTWLLQATPTLLFPRSCSPVDIVRRLAPDRPRKKSRRVAKC
jgi:hypothetical protein